MEGKSMITESSRQRVINCLLEEQASCVIYNGGEIRVLRERGVKDLYALLKSEPEFLHGAFVADKVVGKAAASLMILGGVDEVFATTISLPAREFLEQKGVRVDCSQEVPYIENRMKTGWCPLETRCYGETMPEACLQQIEEFMNEMKVRS